MSRDVPSGWRRVDLGDVAKEGRSRNSDLRISEDRLVGVFKDQGMTPMRERVRGTSFERCKVVRPGDFAYNPMRINIGSIARSTADADLMVSPDYVVFSPDTNQIDGLFLDYLRKSDAWAAFVGNSGDGGVRIRIYFEHLARFRFNLPPLHEQRRIAEILSSVDEAIAATRAVIAQTRKVKQGMLERLLTRGIGHTRFKQTEIGAIPEEWEVLRIGDFCRVQGGYAFKSSEFQEDGAPLVRISNIRGGSVDLEGGPRLPQKYLAEFAQFVVDRGDILMALSGATTGKWGVADLEEAALLNQRVGRFVLTNCRRVSSKFLPVVVEKIAESVLEKAYGGAQPNISPNTIEKIVVAVPGLSEQEFIGDYVKQSDLAAQTDKNRLAALFDLKSALTSDLLTGRKRVTDALPMAAE